jgi:2-polyprenyl-6-methoxyphenol hydroxylase-like FAD-dependent oxidoreductase
MAASLYGSGLHLIHLHGDILTIGNSKPPQVLIVGAGPVGLTMAVELARYGVGVRIIDKVAVPTEKSRAVVVWGRTLELLDRMGCADGFIAAGIRAGAAHLIATRDREGRAIRIDLGLLTNPFPYALMLPQSATERLLTEHLAGLGVSIERSLELTQLRQSEDHVEAELRHADGRIETMRADWLGGCDGAHSAVRKLIGQKFSGHTFPTEWLMADLNLRGVPTPPGEPALFFHADGILALFPIGPDNLYRLAANLGPALEEGRGRDVSLAEIQALITRRGPAGLTATRSSWHATFRINERQVESYRSQRVFLVGDAAHIHSPAGGQGMNTGMQDAVNLAWKLALICRGDLALDAGGQRLLDSYGVERRAVGTQTLRVAGRMTALGLMTHPLTQGLRNRIAKLVMRWRPVQRALARQLSGLTVRYQISSLNGSGRRGGKDDPRAGHRFPMTARHGEGGRAPRFHLVGDIASAEAARLAALFPRLLDAKVMALPEGMRQGRLWLLRPDGYVALATTTGDSAAVVTYLSRLMAGHEMTQSRGRLPDEVVEPA